MPQDDASAIAAFLKTKGKTIVPEGTTTYPPVVTGIVLSCFSILARPSYYTKGEYKKAGIGIVIKHVAPIIEGLPEIYTIAGNSKHATVLEFGKTLCFPIQPFAPELEKELGLSPKRMPRYRVRPEKIPYDPNKRRAPKDPLAAKHS